ncbi:MAG: dephospho-CoA kinase [Firmicutes bacterium]|nr:dephospho-CoA kinase [Bacillota bacterium]
MRQNNKVLVIGLTGTIASGKSTVSRYLKRMYHAVHIDADLVAREVVQSEAVSLSEVFGPEILTEDGIVDRKALGRIVFQNPEALETLNRMVHPATVQRIADDIEKIRKRKTNQDSSDSFKGSQIVVVEAIELLRSGLKDIVDTIWVVYADPKIRQLRMMNERNLSEQDAADRISSQWDDETYRAHADQIIKSIGGDVKLLYDQVDDALERCL